MMRSRQARHAGLGRMMGAMGFAVMSICCWGAAADELEVRASWSVPEAATSRQALVQWLKGEPDSETSLLKLDALWPPEMELSADEVLPKISETVAALYEPASELLTRISVPATPATVLTAPAVLGDEKLPEAIRANLRLVWTKWLVENQFLDEALEVSGALQTDEVADPAGLLFYRSVAFHRLLKKDECLPELTRLLENEDALPRRYRTVAKLMAADLKPLQTDTLDEVARLMSDVRRQLDLGRAGARVRQEEDDIVKKLEKLIKDLEEQQQQSSGAAGGSAQSSRPMQDSQPGGGTGPGNVAPKNLGNRSEWGDLPPKEREAALQEITKELPAHFRSVIEEYFRKLARTDS